MKRTFATACALAFVLGTPDLARARGVSPYLPVNLSPEMERQIEQVLILAGQPVMTRPIAAATVHDALPKACERDEALCRSVRRYLERYMQGWGVTDLSLEAMNERDEVLAVPNQHGMNSDSPWRASARGYWQPGEHVLIALGGTAYDGDAVPNGSVVSLGFEYLQLDAGWLDYSMSPLTDSSMLLSTESQTMPQVSISNYTPLTRLGLRYRVLWAKMAHSDQISFEGGLTSGRPELFGVSGSIEPMSGWAFGVNRLMQYGGGGRGGASVGDILEAFFDPTRYDNTGDLDEQFGNQVASITSSFLYPGATPFAVHVEYAGEDTVRNRNHLLGNAALSVGIRWPLLWQRFDVALEATEWQNAWYVHPIYGDGLANEGHVLGHWAADQRVFNDDVGGHAATLRIGWRPEFGGLAHLRVRASEPEDYSPVEYTQGYEFALGYAREIGGMTAGLELVTGRDVFGEDYSQVRGYARYASLASGPAVASADYEPAQKSAEIFVDAGVSATKVRIDESSEQPVEETSVAFAPHFAIGARRLGSGRNDVGVRLELDEVEGHLLTSVRAVDYRYRFESPLALGFFLGASRYDRETPAYGLYYGVGAHWRDLLSGWDVSLDARFAEKVGRDHLLPDDPVSERPVSYYDIYGLTLYVARRF